MYLARELWWGVCKPTVLESPVSVAPPGGGGDGLLYGDLLRLNRAHRAKTQGAAVAAQMAVVMGF